MISMSSPASSQATAEANNLAAVAAAKDLYNKKMEEVGESSWCECTSNAPTHPH